MKAARFERLSHCQANKRIHGRVIVSRIESVDVARLIAVTAVIAIHTQPFFGSASIQGKYLSVAIDQLARFAVPLFFVISGSFWGIKIKNGAPIVPTSVAMAKRIFYIFIFWSIVYLLPYDLSTIADHGLLGPIKNAYWNLLKLADKPATVLMQGTKVHLWFLIALLCSVGISAFFVEKKHYKTLFVLATALYVFGLVGKAYADTPFGIHVNFNTRNGPFFGTIFFVSGYALSNLKPNPSWFAKGIALLAIGIFLHFAEVYFLWHTYGTSPYQDYVMGTYFMGVGAAMAALSNHAMLKNKVLSEFGKYTLGIYAVHLIFVENLHPVSELTHSPLWAVGYVMLVLLLSIATVLLLARTNFGRKFVA
jgi:surface polysaccharide O-acyltransferase-like enzyme